MIKKSLNAFGKYCIFIWKCFSVPDKWREFFRRYVQEILRLGIDSIPLVLIVSVFIGAVCTIQMKLNITSPLLPKYAIGLTTREIILLEFSSSILCLILSGKVGSNIASEIGTMRVTEQIDAFQKLKFESDFQKLSPGGAISYVEVPNMQNNIPAVLTVMKFIYDNIMYAELNTKSDFCECCGYDGEIQIEEDETGKLIWRCPNCGNTNQDKLFVARRTCGYIGTQFWNQGRTQEIKDRVLHL